jgi:hypothetical protein
MWYGFEEGLVNSSGQLLFLSIVNVLFVAVVAGAIIYGIIKWYKKRNK